MVKGFDQNISHMYMDIKYFKNKKINRNIYEIEKQNELTAILTKQEEVDEDGGFYQVRKEKGSTV